jgi:hypothetical protein
VPRKLKRPGKTSQRADGLLRKIPAELLLNGDFGIQKIQRLLGKISHFQARPEPDNTGVWFHSTGNNLEQSGFSSPVFSHDAPALSSPEIEVQSVINDAFPVGLLHAFKCDHLIAGPWRLTKIELHDRSLSRQLDFLDLIEGFHAALYLRGLGSVRGKSIDEALFLCEHGLLASVGRLTISLPDGSLPFIKIVIARIGVDFAAIDFSDSGDDAIHEFAVVRCHEQGAGQRLQKAFEPDDRFDVEVIRRLVHQENIRTSQQNTRHGDTHFPSAREFSRVIIDSIVVKSQPCKHLARLTLESIPAKVIVLLLYFAKACQYSVHFPGAFRIRHRMLQRFKLMMQISDPAAACNSLIKYRAARHFFHVLAEIAYGEFLRRRDIAVIRLFFPDDHAEERGLA